MKSQGWTVKDADDKDIGDCFDEEMWLMFKEARRLDGMLAGSLQPEEYEHLVKAGLLHFSYEGAAGFMGLAKLRFKGTKQWPNVS